MKKLIVVLTATLALPAGAAAKELKSAVICGTDGCGQAQNRQALVVAFEDGGPPDVPEAGELLRGMKRQKTVD